MSRLSLLLFCLFLTSCAGSRGWLNNVPEWEAQAYLQNLDERSLCAYSRGLTSWEDQYYIAKGRVTHELKRRGKDPLFCTQEYQTCLSIGYDPAADNFKDCLKETINQQKIQEEMSRQTSIMRQQLYEEQKKNRDKQECYRKIDGKEVAARCYGD